MIQVITVNYNSLVLVDNLYKSLIPRTVFDYRFNVCDNGSVSDQLSELIKWSEDKDKVRVFKRQQSMGGSAAHGEALNFMAQKFDSDDVIVIVDNDCYMIDHKWDRRCIRALDSGASFLCTHSKFRPEIPGPFFMVCKKSFLDENRVDFMPAVKNAKGQALSGKDVGYRLKGIPGWCSVKVVTSGKELPVEDSHLFILGRSVLASHFNRGRRAIGRDDNRLDRWLRFCRSLDNV